MYLEEAAQRAQQLVVALQNQGQCSASLGWGLMLLVCQASGGLEWASVQPSRLRPPPLPPPGVPSVALFGHEEVG